MKIENKGYMGLERFYEELTPDEFTLAVQSANDLELNYLSSPDEDPTFIGLVQATPEQVTAFEAAMGITTG